MAFTLLEHGAQSTVPLQTCHSLAILPSLVSVQHIRDAKSQVLGRRMALHCFKTIGSLVVHWEGAAVLSLRHL